MRDLDNTSERCTRLLYISSLSLEIGDGEVLKTGVHGVSVYCTYLYYPTVWGDSEQPTDDEYLEIQSIQLLSPAWLTNGKGISVSIDGRCDLGTIFTNAQIDKLSNFLLDNPDAEAINSKELML